MSKPTIHPIPYQQNSSDLFSKLQHLPWAVFLDSCQPQSEQGRYDIMSAYPHITLTTQGNSTTINTKKTSQIKTTDPFTELQKSLKKISIPNILLPFLGGAIGYFSYDLGRRLENFPSLAQQDILIPEMAVGIYDWALIVDHKLHQAHLVSINLDEDTPAIIEEIKSLLTSSININPEIFRLISPLTSNMTREFYGKAFRKIMNYIREGDCYQVNLAQRFSAKYIGDPWQIYQHLRKKILLPMPLFCKIPTPLY